MEYGAVLKMPNSSLRHKIDIIKSVLESKDDK